MTRAKRAERVHALKAQGLNGVEIAKRMRLSRSYTYALIHDPTGEQDRERKASYGGTCEECGGPTSGNDGRAMAPKVCGDCLQPRWTQEEAIAACDAFFAKHHRSPRVVDSHRSDRALPHESSAIRLFGGWNKMLLAVGLPLNLDRRDSTQAAMERMLRTGMSVHEVAQQFGWTDRNVYERLKTRGLTPQDLGARDYRAEWQEQREYIARRYREGAPLAEIADELGCTRGNVNVLVCKMRKDGVDLPYRNPGAAGRFEPVAA